MPVFKRKYRSGKTTWWFSFDAPASGREERRRVTESGFSTKAAALAAEADRRVSEQKKYELSKTIPVEVPLPKRWDSC